MRNLRTGQEKRQLDLYDYLDYPDEVSEASRPSCATGPGCPPSQRKALVDFLVANAGPDLHLNQSETLRRQDAAAAPSSRSSTGCARGR